MHRHFFRNTSQNPEYIQTHCNNRRNPFHFASRKRYLYNNPQCRQYTYTKSNTNINIFIHILVQILFNFTNSNSKKYIIIRTLVQISIISITTFGNVIMD